MTDRAIRHQAIRQMRQAHRSEEVIGRIRNDGQWDRRYRIEQAGPREFEPQMPLVRLVNIFLSALALWLVIIGWGLSLAAEAGWLS